VSQPVICDTCRRALDVHMTADGATYRHTLVDPADHPAVPIPAPPGWDEGRCDFCSAEPPRFELPVRDFRLPQLDPHMSLGGWAACEPCARLIEANRWNELERRAVAAYERRNGIPLPPDAQSALRGLYRRLRQHISGSLRPITPEKGTD
jgi:hypothetical protein